MRKSSNVWSQASLANMAKMKSPLRQKQASVCALLEETIGSDDSSDEEYNPVAASGDEGSDEEMSPSHEECSEGEGEEEENEEIEEEVEAVKEESCDGKAGNEMVVDKEEGKVEANNEVVGVVEIGTEPLDDHGNRGVAKGIDSDELSLPIPIPSASDDIGVAVSDVSSLNDAHQTAADCPQSSAVDTPPTLPLPCSVTPSNITNVPLLSPPTSSSGNSFLPTRSVTPSSVIVAPPPSATMSTHLFNSPPPSTTPTYPSVNQVQLPTSFTPPQSSISFQSGITLSSVHHPIAPATPIHEATPTIMTTSMSTVPRPPMATTYIPTSLGAGANFPGITCLSSIDHTSPTRATPGSSLVPPPDDDLIHETAALLASLSDMIQSPMKSLHCSVTESPARPMQRYSLSENSAKQFLSHAKPTEHSSVSESSAKPMEHFSISESSAKLMEQFSISETMEHFLESPAKPGEQYSISESAAKPMEDEQLFLLNEVCTHGRGGIKKGVGHNIFSESGPSHVTLC